MKPGDVIRVRGDWPNTKGRRFTVLGTSKIDYVDAKDKDGKIRTFPKDLCVVDMKASRANKTKAS